METFEINGVGPLGHPRRIIPYLGRYSGKFYRPDFYEPEDNTPVLVVLDKDCTDAFMVKCPLHVGEFYKDKGFWLDGAQYTRFDIRSWCYPPHVEYVGRFKWSIVLLIK